MIEKRFNLGMKGSLIKSLLQRLLPGGEIDTAMLNKVSDLGNLTQAIFDDATYPHPYFGTAIDLAGQPTSGQYRVIYIPYFSHTEGYSVQIAVGAVGNDGLHWRKAFGKTWMPWGPTKPQEYDLPLAAGLVDVGGEYRKNQFGEASLCLAATGPIAADAVVATLPAGYRPASDKPLPVTAITPTAMVAGYCVIEAATGHIVNKCGTVTGLIGSRSCVAS